MNPDWQFPTPLDELNTFIDPDPGNTCYQSQYDDIGDPRDSSYLFWAEQFPSATTSGQDSTSLDVTAAEPYLYMDWECECNLSGVYCVQHGEYGIKAFGDASVPPEADLNPDSSLERTNEASSPLDHMAEFGPADFSDHIPTSIPTIPLDESGSTSSPTDEQYGLQSLQGSTASPVEKHSRRSNIDANTKQTLEAYFDKDPYPNKCDMVHIAESTGLTLKTIRNWFSNTRSRKAGLTGSPSKSSNRRTRKRKRSSTSSHTSSSVSAERLEALGRLSPVPIISSMDRYLATSPQEDAVPAAALDSLSVSRFSYSGAPSERVRARVEQSSVSPFAEGLASMKPPEYPLIPNSTDDPFPLFESQLPLSKHYTPPTRFFTPSEQAFSSRSKSSMGSHNSFRSSGSCISGDSRGSRRGRKGWIPLSLVKDKTDYPNFCTWPDCQKTFRYRSEWTRHEEAIHYCPYHWICCLEVKTVMRLPRCFICGERDVLLSHLTEHHFSSCAGRDLDDRTFLREDQLAQHMKSAHLDAEISKSSIPKDVLAAWKMDNPSLTAGSLHCGFCGLVFKTWEQRQDHVFEHLKIGICKSAWWPGRLPTVPSSVTCNGTFTCPACTTTFADIATALKEHSTCVTWSCRYLLDWHRLFRLGSRPQMTFCRLCTFKTPAPRTGRLEDTTENFQCELESHAEAHGLRDCDQDVYRAAHLFQQHMAMEHGTVYDNIDNWRSVQNLRVVEGKVSVRTSGMFGESVYCPSQNPGCHCVFIEGDNEAQAAVL